MGLVGWTVVMVGWGGVGSHVPAGLFVLVTGVAIFRAVVHGARASEAGELVVNDRFNATRLRREDIDSVLVDHCDGLWNPAVVVVLRDGERVPIAATAVPFAGRRRERQRAELEAWVRADGRPLPWWELPPPPPEPARRRDTR